MFSVISVFECALGNLVFLVIFLISSMCDLNMKVSSTTLSVSVSESGVVISAVILSMVLTI